jgi:hypothetical protein
MEVRRMKPREVAGIAAGEAWARVGACVHGSVEWEIAMAEWEVFYSAWRVAAAASGVC